MDDRERQLIERWIAESPDPYSDALTIVRCVLTAAERESGRMSEGEYEYVTAIRSFIRPEW